MECSRRLVGQRLRPGGFTNTEEDAVGLTEVVPFLAEDQLKRAGGTGCCPTWREPRHRIGSCSVARS